MSVFEFKTDASSQQFCERIVDEMTRAFGIPREEAVGRINRQWRGKPILGDTDMVYHEDPEYWARRIYYKATVKWWIPGAKLEPEPWP